MRRGYRRKVKRKIRLNGVLLALGAIVLVAAVFFASFWITSLVLRAGREPFIPVQTDTTAPPDDALPQTIKPEAEQTDVDEEEKEESTATTAPPEKPKESSPAVKPDPKPEESSKPKNETEKENVGQTTEKKPEPEVKPSEQPSAPQEKPVVTPEPVEPQQPVPTPVKPSIEIVSPNVG